MTMRNPTRRNSHRRRGTVITYVAITGTLLIGFAALAVDAGNLYRVRAELQNAADAAALAGALAYFESDGLTTDEMRLTETIVEFATDASKWNMTLGDSTALERKDLLIGRHDFSNPWGPIDGTAEVRRWNAADTTTRRTAESVNGPVPFFFAAIFGKSSGDVTAHARAAAEDRVAGIRIMQTTSFLPFALDERLYDTLSREGEDDYSYDGGVVNLSDGVSEVNIFPWRRDFTLEELDGTSDFDETEFATDAAGNFGVLNIGGDLGTSVLSEQITNGLTGQELQATFGTSDLVFHDSSGTPKTYPVTGSPGLSNGIADELTAKVGDLISFFVHQGVQRNGANATFAISGVRYGRIVEVNLIGDLKERSLTIQPVPMTLENLILNQNAPSCDRHLGRVMLVQ